MFKYLSGWINLGFLLGLAIFTTVTLQVPNKPHNDAEFSKVVTLNDGGRKVEYASHFAGMPAMLMTASLPRPSQALRHQVEMVTNVNHAKVGYDDQIRLNVQPELNGAQQSKGMMGPDWIEPLSPQRGDLDKKNDKNLEDQLVALPLPEDSVRPLFAPLKMLDVNISRPETQIPKISPMAPKFELSTPSKSLRDQKKAVVVAKAKPWEVAPNFTAHIKAKIKSAQLGSADVVVKPDAVDFARARQLINDPNAMPSLEFLWPSNKSSHHRIYHVLTKCLGMVVGQVNDVGHVILASGQGVTALNKSLHSPLLRSLEKPVTNDEARAVASLNGAPDRGNLVRIFRRDMDVRLLAGLQKLTKNMDYKTGPITAEYFLTNDGLYLDKVTHNGAALPGQIRLHKGQCA